MISKYGLNIRVHLNPQFSLIWNDLSIRSDRCLIPLPGLWSRDQRMLSAHQSSVCSDVSGTVCLCCYFDWITGSWDYRARCKGWIRRQWHNLISLSFAMWPYLQLRHSYEYSPCDAVHSLLSTYVPPAWHYTVWLSSCCCRLQSRVEDVDWCFSSVT